MINVKKNTGENRTKNYRIQIKKKKRLLIHLAFGTRFYLLGSL